MTTNPNNITGDLRSFGLTASMREKVLQGTVPLRIWADAHFISENAAKALAIRHNAGLYKFDSESFVDAALMNQAFSEEKLKQKARNNSQKEKARLRRKQASFYKTFYDLNKNVDGVIIPKNSSDLFAVDPEEGGD